MSPVSVHTHPHLASQSKENIKVAIKKKVKLTSILLRVNLRVEEKKYFGPSSVFECYSCLRAARLGLLVSARQGPSVLRPCAARYYRRAWELRGGHSPPHTLMRAHTWGIHQKQVASVASLRSRPSPAMERFLSSRRHTRAAFYREMLRTRSSF